MKKTILTICALIVASIGYTETQVPNSFQAGQVARAAEVNENFDTLGTAIDQNALRLDQAISALLVQQVSESAVSVVSAACPANTTILSAQCGCSDEFGPRNLGVLFACEVAGNAGVGGCFNHLFDPTLPFPIAKITVVCASAELGPSVQSDAIKKIQSIDAPPLESPDNELRTLLSNFQKQVSRQAASLKVGNTN